MYRYRHLIRTLVLLLVLAGAAYGGIKGWMYLNVQRAMEEISVATAGQVTLAYEGIDTSLSGSVTLRGLSVVPAGAPVPVRIDAARLSGPPLRFFLLGQDRNDPPPPRMYVDVEGLRVSLDPELLANLREQFGELDLKPGTGCGAGDDMNPELLSAMGFSELVINAGFSYDYNAPERRLEALMDFDLQDMERVQASFVLGDVQPDALAGGSVTLPTLVRMSMDMKVDPVFGNGYMKACADKLKMGVEQYRSKLVNETLVLLANAGLQLGPGLNEALSEFHKDWGSVRFNAQPEAPLNPMSLMFSPPADWRSALGITLAVNGREVHDLSFELSPPDPEELAILLGQEVERKAPRVKQPRYRRVFRSVPAGELAQHVGKEVKLQLTGDQLTRSGLLVEAGAGELKVQQRLHGGKFTAHVLVKDVASAEVQFVEEIPQGK